MLLFQCFQLDTTVTVQSLIYVPSTDRQLTRKYSRDTPDDFVQLGNITQSLCCLIRRTCSTWLVFWDKLSPYQGSGSTWQISSDKTTLLQRRNVLFSYFFPSSLRRLERIKKDWQQLFLWLCHSNFALMLMWINFFWYCLLCCYCFSVYCKK